MKTSELKGAALDWAVAKCEGKSCLRAIQESGGDWFKSYDYNFYFAYSINWALGGPIIERERMNVLYWTGLKKWAAKPDKEKEAKNVPNYFGDTLLEAAMRCYVASKLGAEIEVPEELL